MKDLGDKLWVNWGLSEENKEEEEEEVGGRTEIVWW